MCAAASQACPYLGRCDDPGNYYFFPTTDNCCHSEKRPFAIEPAYQARICLGGEWAACRRYNAVSGGVTADEQVAVSAPRPATRRLSPWFVGGALAAGAILLVAGFLILGPRFRSWQPPPLTGSPTPSLDATTVVAALTTAPSSATPAMADSDEPTPTAHQPSATPTSMASSTWTPTSTATTTRTPTATVTETPTRTPSPTFTQTPASTRTPIPTFTQTPVPTRTPADMPSPTTRPTRRPTATSTPLPAPVLFAPPDGQAFSQDAEIVLEWQPLAGLPADGYYAITVAYTHFGATWYDDVPWTRDTSWILSEHEYLLGLSDDGWFRWSVQAMRQTGVDAASNRVGLALGPRSYVRTLRWMQGGGGVPATQEPSPSPPPTTPLPPPPTTPPPPPP